MDEREKELREIEMDEYQKERKEVEREAEEWWAEHRSGRAFGVSDKDF